MAISQSCELNKALENKHDFGGKTKSFIVRAASWFVVEREKKHVVATLSEGGCISAGDAVQCADM